MNISEKKSICIHKYITKPYTINNIKRPPSGLGDFLRGTVALFKLSEIYNYDIFIDKKSHIFFSYFEDDENYINNGYINNEFELWENNSYKLEELFKSQEDFSINTNAFYTKDENGEYVNFGKIPENIQNKLKKLLIPNKNVKDKLEYVFKNIYNLKDGEKIKTFHIRLGDKYLVKNEKSINYKIIFEMILKVVKFIIDNKYIDYKYILLTDSSELAFYIINNIPEILYWDNKKTHMGYSDNQNQENILDTIIDFITLTKSEEIIGNDSGFSRSVSEIYNIKYNHIFDISYFN